MNKKNLPNLIIAGVTKAGTTSIFTYLAAHPEICPASIKEVCYFLPLRFNEPILPISNYHNYFNHCSTQKYLMEASPAYFFGGKKISHTIKKEIKSPKIIIVLRNPADRLFSFFKFHKNMLSLDKNLSFSDYLQICQNFDFHDSQDKDNYIYFNLAGGIYKDYIIDWLEAFREDLKILFFEDLKDDTRHFIKNLCEWIDIDSAFYDSYDFQIENKAQSYKFKFLHQVSLTINQKCEKFFRKQIALKRLIRRLYYSLNSSSRKDIMQNNEEQFLLQYYAPHNKELYDILKQAGYRRLPDWLLH